MFVKPLIGALFAASIAFTATAGDRGTREEAMTMSHAAKALIEAEGRDAAIAAINDPNDARFHDRDLYVYYLDGDNHYLAHGAKPALMGKDASGLTDPTGVKIVQEMRALVDAQGEGWVDYQWPNPVSGKLEKKSGYIEAADDGAVIGVGVYSE